MSDKLFSASFLKKNLALLISIILFTICMAASIALISTTKEYSEKTYFMPIIDEIEDIIKVVQECNDGQDCSIILRLENVYLDSIAFTDKIRKDNVAYRNPMNMELNQLDLAMSRFVSTNNHDTLILDLQKIVILLQTEEQNFIHAYYSDSRKIELTFISFGTVVSFIIMLLVLIKNARSRIHDSSKKESVSLASLPSLENQELEKISADLLFSDADRDLAVYLLKLRKRIEDQKNNSAVSLHLQSLIGSEIKSITHTIDCCVRLLTKNADQSDLVITKEIDMATHTLADLADNYTKFISSRRNKELTTISLDHLMEELITHLKTKASSLNKQMDCYFDDNLPLKFNGHYTSLFWVLFAQLSKIINNTKQPYLLLQIRSGTAQAIEDSRITIDLITHSEPAAQLSVFENAYWQKAEYTPDVHDQSSVDILSFTKYFQHTVLSAEGMEKNFFEIDVKPNKFGIADKQLDGKRILLCAGYALESDIIKSTLERYESEVVEVVSPNDLFKYSKGTADFDAIVLTDNIQGIELQSFIKTLAARFKDKETKIIQFVSSGLSLQTSVELVDLVFHLPFNPAEVIPKMSKILKSKTQKKTVEDQKVLLIENDDSQSSLLVQILENKNATIDTISDKLKAVAYFRANLPNIIFIDCSKSTLACFETIRTIRQIETINKSKSPCTIIGSTVSSNTIEHKEYLDVGMNHVIMKPYKFDEINKIIQQHVVLQKIY